MGRARGQPPMLPHHGFIADARPIAWTRRLRALRGFATPSAPTGLALAARAEAAQAKPIALAAITAPTLVIAGYRRRAAAAIVEFPRPLRTGIRA